MYQLLFLVMTGDWAPNADICPVRKSASARPVAAPENVKVALEPAKSVPS